MCIYMQKTVYVYPARLRSPWNSPDKNTGVGCHFLVQGIFLTQGLNSQCLLKLLNWQVKSLPEPLRMLIHIYICVYIYIYIWDMVRDTHMCVYIYIYTHTHTHI